MTLKAHKLELYIVPFIGTFLPFVGTIKPSIIPFIRNNIPFVIFRKNIHGFTLIELIVTITIVGILAAVAAPNVSGFTKDNRLSSQANDLLADLGFTRSEAIKRVANINICKQDTSQSTPQCNNNVAGAWTGGRVIFIDTDNDGLVTAGETVLKVRESLTGNNTLTVTSTTENLGAIPPNPDAARRIVFTGSGMTTITSGEEAGMRFCDNRGVSKAATVFVNSTGRARISRTPPASCP